MKAAERKALTDFVDNLSWARQSGDVWNLPDFHVSGLHEHVVRSVLTGVLNIPADAESNPLGFVIQGLLGSGKTHLLSLIRERVVEKDGYFFLIGPQSSQTPFWSSVAVAICDGLHRRTLGGVTQLAAFLSLLAHKIDAPESLREIMHGDRQPTCDDLTMLVEAVWRYDRDAGLKSEDALRALLLYSTNDFGASQTGYTFLLAHDEIGSDIQAAWGFRSGTRSALETVRAVSRLLALTGPTVFATDQIDGIAQGIDDEPNDGTASKLLNEVADGLILLRENTRRTLCVLSCLPSTWMVMKTHAVATLADRFHELSPLSGMGDRDMVEEILARRLAPCYQAAGLKPTYRTWPVTSAVFDDLCEYTPRAMFKLVDAHIRRSLLAAEVTEFDHIDEAAQTQDDEEAVPPLPPPEIPSGALEALDAEFARLRLLADVDAVLNHQTEDAVAPGLLTAGLEAWLAETDGVDDFTIDPPPGTKPSLHARLRRTLDVKTAAQAHWSFRAIAAPDPRATLSRLQAASTAAGLDTRPSQRFLFLLRNGEWSRGAKNQETLSKIYASGGATLPFDEDDVRTLSALQRLLADQGPSLREWLRTRRPARGTRLFGAALALAGPTPTPGPEPPGGGKISNDQPLNADRIVFGESMDTGAHIQIDLEALRRHTVVFAGTGSGKTVLIRRLVEECALRGVSSIVLDPNNDLARLGQAWPEAPDGWGDGDAEQARGYLDHTEVVVWTPGRVNGRPITFQPLPDFASVLSDEDEFNQAIEAAVVALASRANVDGRARRARLSHAVLRGALRHFARSGGTSLTGFIKLLADLPEGVVDIRQASRLAAETADMLTAARLSDPLFAGVGEPADPGVLLTPGPGKRARVSVMSFVGLPSDEGRRSFVNQLQMALFAWVKKHPAGDRPLGGLFVMDEAQSFAPSSGQTASGESTVVLASQARKYGLGLVFATQAPKSLHNRVSGNAATQLYGRLNANVQIAAAQEMARARGSNAPDLGQLKVGQFYVAGESISLQKMRTPMCLSHHPKSPLAPEQVVELARRGQPPVPLGRHRQSQEDS
jgi:DNA helicase HerA-like ATPase